MRFIIPTPAAAQRQAFNRFSRSLILSLALLAGALLSLAPSAHASLGGHEDTVDTDATTYKAAHVKSQSAKYTMHEVTTSTTTVHEYADATGQIFAVTWQGIVRPDLKVLFGDYYSEYDQAAAKIVKGKGRQYTTVKTAHVVVHRGGHMRDLRGRAYIPSLVPESVDVESLQ